MHIVVYPAKLLEKEGVILVSFPDVEGCFSEGVTTEDATINAQEALGLHLSSLQERKLDIPKASKLADVVCVKNEDKALITTDVDKYHKCKSVKKNLTIPSWLNERAEERNINFSQLLQRALREELSI